MYFVTLWGGIDVFDFDIDTGAVNRSQFVTIAAKKVCLTGWRSMQKGASG